ncbi:MAG: hypothetical protein ACRDVW_08070 [Acidimicrobiales bacterium]
MTEHQTDPTEIPPGGDPACWSHLVCPECGAVEIEGHRADCRIEQSDDPGVSRI